MKTIFKSIFKSSKTKGTVKRELSKPSHIKELIASYNEKLKKSRLDEDSLYFYPSLYKSGENNKYYILEISDGGDNPWGMAAYTKTDGWRIISDYPHGGIHAYPVIKNIKDWLLEIPNEVINDDYSDEMNEAKKAAQLFLDCIKNWK